MSFVGSRGLEGSHGAPFALSVLGAALFTGIAAFVLSVLDDAPYFELPALLALSALVFFIAGIVIGLAAGLIGLPLTWLFARWRLEGPLAYPLAGFVAGGAIAIFVPYLTGRPGESLLQLVPFAWIGALPGCVCGAIWWLTYRRHAQEPGEERG